MKFIFLPMSYHKSPRSGRFLFYCINPSEPWNLQAGIGTNWRNPGMPRLTARVREMMIPDQNKGELRDQIMSICKSNYAELVRSKDDLA
ncbi:MAG: hypothetical protein J6W70_03260 [Lentisphaeria bacterium]|nr:hypothetical protein [Lentisphaeria bacterium]